MSLFSSFPGASPWTPGIFRGLSRTSKGVCDSPVVGVPSEVCGETVSASAGRRPVEGYTDLGRAKGVSGFRGQCASGGLFCRLRSAAESFLPGGLIHTVVGVPSRTRIAPDALHR